MVLLIGLLVMIAACSAPAPEPVNEPVTNEVPVPGSDVPEAVVGQEHIVEIKGFKFVPAELTVKPGDTVTWINQESTAHTVTASAGDFESDRLKNN